MLLQETELKILSIKIFAKYQDTIKPCELTTVSLEWAIVPSPSPAVWENIMTGDDINHDWGLFQQLLDSPSPLIQFISVKGKRCPLPDLSQSALRSSVWLAGFED